LEEIQQVLQRYDILLIVDEVVLRIWAFGYAIRLAGYGIEPDLVTVGKGLTSGYQPLSGALVGEKSGKFCNEVPISTVPSRTATLFRHIGLRGGRAC